MANAFTTIALIGKYKSPEIAEPLLELSRFLQNRGVRVLLDPLTAAHVARSSLEVLPLEEAGRLSDLAIVIGGDGTMLNIARTLAPYDVPVVGVNQGRFGFLTDISVHTMLQTIGDMLDGNFVTEARMLLACQLVRGEEQVLDVLALSLLVSSLLMPRPNQSRGYCAYNACRNAVLQIEEVQQVALKLVRPQMGTRRCVN